MDWEDEGIVLGVRRHGEAHAIVELLTHGHGRHLGMVRGGASRRQAPVLQPGNSVRAVWRARLDAHMGTYVLEPLVLRTQALMSLPHAAYGITHMATLLHLLPERDPHPGLHTLFGAILDAFEAPQTAGQLLARFELALLAELGFALELDACGATGGRNDLAYVSPRTGRAVSRAAGEPYAARLFALPPFLIGQPGAPAAADVAEALRLTGFFLTSRVLDPRGLAFCEARAGFIAAWQRAAQRQ